MTTLLKGQTRRAQFIRAGVVLYDEGTEEEETILIREENLFNIARTAEGVPIVVGHPFIDDSNVDELKKGICGRVYEGFAGFKDVDLIIGDDEALQLVNSGFSVSCSLKPTKTLGAGTYNNVPYDREIVEAQIVHMGLVEDPRYEEAAIFENSKSSKKKEDDNNIIKASMFKLFTNSKKNKEMDLENTNILVGEDTFKASELLENSKDGKSLVLKTDLLNNEGDKDKDEDKDKKDNQKEEDDKKDDTKDNQSEKEDEKKAEEKEKAKDNEGDDKKDKEKEKMFKVNGSDKTLDEVLKLAAKADKKDNAKDDDEDDDDEQNNKKNTKNNSIKGALNDFIAKASKKAQPKSSYIPIAEKRELGKKMF